MTPVHSGQTQPELCRILCFTHFKKLLLKHVAVSLLVLLSVLLLTVHTSVHRTKKLKLSILNILSHPTSSFLHILQRGSSNTNSPKFSRVMSWIFLEKIHVKTSMKFMVPWRSHDQVISQIHIARLPALQHVVVEQINVLWRTTGS